MICILECLIVRFVIGLRELNFICVQDAQCQYLVHVAPLITQVARVRQSYLATVRQMNLALSQVDANHERLVLENRFLRDHLDSLLSEILYVFSQYEISVPA